MQSETQVSWKALMIVGAIFSTSFIVHGCNFFSFMDKPKSQEELHIDALAKIDQDKCSDAIESLKKIGETANDQTYRLRGWANLCTAGIKLKNVLKTLMTYSSSSENLDVVGKLAASIIPQTSGSVTTIQTAIDDFGKQTASGDRTLNITLGYVLKAAAYVAKASSDGTTVKKADVAPGGCQASCTDGTGCTEVKMDNTDANGFGDALIKAGNTVAGDSTFGAVKDLVGKLKEQASATVANLNRCVVYNKILKE